jgi:type IV pilus assembly protein PilE
METLSRRNIINLLFLKESGFTLLELLFTLAIIAVLFNFAYPSYQSSIARSNRAKAKVEIMIIAHKIEKYYLENEIALNISSAKFLPKLNKNAPYEYQISFEKPEKKGYIIKAIPKREQSVNDPQCQILSFNHKGQKIASTGAHALCWQ